MTNEMEAMKRDDFPHWHVFSVNYRKDRQRGRRYWLHRAWFAFHGGEVASVEIAMPGRLSFRFKLGDGDEHPISGNVGLGLLSFHWGLGWWTHRLPVMAWMRARYGYESREISVDWNGEACGFFWSLWMRPDEWRRRDPKWRRGSFIPVDVVFGRQRCQNTVLNEHEQVSVVIPGDPNPYSAKVVLGHPVWTRKRWPWWPLTRENYTASIDVENGIPIPGKGENSWDIDDDAVYGLTTSATTVDEAVAALVASVQRSRARHGGPNWEPRFEKGG